MSVALVVKAGPTVPGASAQTLSTIALDTSYPNPAGYVFTPQSFGLTYLRKIKNLEPTSLPAAATWSYWIVPTFSTDGQFILSFALHLAVVSTGVQVANAVDVSTATYTIEVEGN